MYLITIVICFLVIICCIITIFELTTYNSFGQLISNDKVDEYLRKYQPFKKNPYNGDLISPKLLIDGLPHNEFIDRLSNGGYISTTSFSITTKYYISGLGCVPRWSKSHKKIKNLFKSIN